VSSSGRAAGLAGKGSEGGHFCFALFFFTKEPAAVGQRRLRVAAVAAARSWSAAAAAEAAAASSSSSSSSSFSFSSPSVAAAGAPAHLAPRSGRHDQSRRQHVGAS
jgi:hypothetical protein